MSEEHGYQRSGKKCREKFENLYKYYKKTKEGKAGRQDGKHYRFFRQLEALYGETSNNNNNNNIPNNHQMISSSIQDYNTNNNIPNNLLFHNLNPSNTNIQSLSLSNESSELESSSSDGNESNRRSRGGWKAKIKEFIDSQMRKLIEKQEAWLEKLMRTIEQKEKERGLREEEWRRQEVARVEREHNCWAKERAWIEARDSALMEALKGLTAGKERALSPELGLINTNPSQEGIGEISINASRQRNPSDAWPESEIMRLIQLRMSMDSRFEQGEEALWDNISTKMGCLGYDRSAVVCRDKWERINEFAKKSSLNHSNKKRKENEQCGGYGNNSASFHNNEEMSSCLYNHGVFNGTNNCDQMNDHGTTSSSPSNNANVGNSTTSTSHHHHHQNNHVVNHDHHGCFPFLMGEGSENLWVNYELKINKGGQN